MNTLDISDNNNIMLEKKKVCKHVSAIFVKFSILFVFGIKQLI